MNHIKVKGAFLFSTCLCSSTVAWGQKYTSWFECAHNATPQNNTLLLELDQNKYNIFQVFHILEEPTSWIYAIINRPGIARAVLQTAMPLTDWQSDHLSPEYLKCFNSYNVTAKKPHNHHHHNPPPAVVGPNPLK